MSIESRFFAGTAGFTTMAFTGGGKAFGSCTMRSGSLAVPPEVTVEGDEGTSVSGVFTFTCAP